MAVVHMHPSREQQVAQTDRFIKPTGKVTVADDKHMYESLERAKGLRWSGADNVGWHT